MKIEILGTGCYKCIQLETLVNAVVQELGRADTQVTRINDERQIRRYMPVDEIPGLVIEGVLCSTMDVPSRETLVSWLSETK